MKRLFMLVLAMLLVSASLPKPASAGAPPTECSAINGRTNANYYSAAVHMQAGDKLTIRLSGAAGTHVEILGPNVVITVPGSYIHKASQEEYFYFYAIADNPGVTVSISCGPSAGGSSEDDSPPCYSLYDGRINNSQALDCAAPIAIYLHSIDIWGISPYTGAGTQIMSINADVLKGPVPDQNTLLSEGTNVISGQMIRVYWLVKTGEVEVVTAYPDGKPYIVVWPIAHPELLYHLAS